MARWGQTARLFEVRARKDGIQLPRRLFRYVYSVWSYGGVEVGLELVRDCQRSAAVQLLLDLRLVYSTELRHEVVCGDLVPVL